MAASFWQVSYGTSFGSALIVLRPVVTGALCATCAQDYLPVSHPHLLLSLED